MHRGLTKQDHATLRSDGKRAYVDGVILSAVKNDDGLCYGFTISKKHGNAVMRNRLRRRLDSALRDASRDLDLNIKVVLVVRDKSTLDSDYAELVADLENALKILVKKIN